MGLAPPLARHLRGKHMAQQGKFSNEGSENISTSSPLARLTDQSQLDFEIDFFGGILKRSGDYVDVLRVMGNNLTLKGRYVQGLEIDRRLSSSGPRTRSPSTIWRAAMPCSSKPSLRCGPYGRLSNLAIATFATCARITIWIPFATTRVSAS